MLIKTSLDVKTNQFTGLSVPENFVFYHLVSMIAGCQGWHQTRIHYKSIIWPFFPPLIHLIFVVNLKHITRSPTEDIQAHTLSRGQRSHHYWKWINLSNATFFSTKFLLFSLKSKMSMWSKIGCGVELETFNILAAGQLRLIRFDNNLLIIALIIEPPSDHCPTLVSNN